MTNPIYGAPGRLDASVDADALDRAAKAYQCQHPGVAYIDAVKAVQITAAAAPVSQARFAKLTPAQIDAQRRR